MRVVTRKRLREFALRFPDARDRLAKWEQVALEARWHSLQDVRRVYPHAVAVTVESDRIVTVFNIGGNRYRLETAIHSNTQRIYVLRMLTHAEYSKGKWKDSLGNVLQAHSSQEQDAGRGPAWTRITWP